MKRSPILYTDGTADIAAGPPNGEKCRPAVSLLIIDDNVGALKLLSSALARSGLDIITTSDAEKGIDLFCNRRPQIVLADLGMPPFSGGMEVLERILEIDPAADVIVMSAHYSAESAVEAIQKGASDYLNKPISVTTLRKRVGKLVEDARRLHRALHLEDELRTSSDFDGIIGRSAAMCEALYRIRRVAPHYRAVLITGGTGTGKDLAARALHRLSPAYSGRFVVLNCSAVVETLFESELFGHVKGSFTGATHEKPGLFEHADGGTLFLDEIGDMPLSTQAKLLRVLQDQEVLRVGALTARKVAVRVIAATNRNLRTLVAQTRFREDLYYRLAMVEIDLPSLEHRKEDLPLLQRHFIARFSAQYKKPIRGLTRRAQNRLSQHWWPGNVRELENVVGYAAMMTVTDMIDVRDLPPYLRAPSEQTWHTLFSPGSNAVTLEAQERRLLLQALARAAGNQSKAARFLRIGRDALRYKIKKHHLEESDSPRGAAAGG